jgi:peptide deformylase
MLNLVKSDDPILTKPCQDFDFKNPPFDPIDFAKDLIKFMYENNAIGLSGNQVGVPYRVFAMRGSPENYVCYNPKIVMPSTEEVLLEESCLTYSGLLVKIKRPQHVRVRFTVPNGEVKTETYTGMTARVFQHQMDYLDGVLFYSRANRYHREQAFKKWKNK